MGINREVAFTIESADQCAQKRVRCMAIPRAAVLKMADQIAELGVLDDDSEKGSDEDFEYKPSSITIARGILPSLRHIVGQEKGIQLPVGGKEVEPDCNINTLGTKGEINPNGNDFFCIVCHAELSNLYYRCRGCEKLLDKDYNICYRCYEGKEHYSHMEMGLDRDTDPAKINWITGRHHTIRDNPDCGARKCNKQKCNQCKQCWECSCCCHGKFDLHRRFYSKKRMTELVKNCKEHVKGDEVPFAKETKKRLEGKQMTIADRVKIPSPYYPTIPREEISRKSKKDR